MQSKTISEINDEYDLEIERIVKTINKEKAKHILLQFPDGLKPYSTTIADFIENKTKAKCIIWLGTCYGACDIPTQIENLKPRIDLVIQFGHSPWNFKDKKIKVIK